MFIYDNGIIVIITMGGDGRYGRHSIISIRWWYWVNVNDNNVEESAKLLSFELKGTL